MNSQTGEKIGSQLGADGVSKVVGDVEQYCAHAERNIELANQPHIETRKAELWLLLEEERRLTERLRDAPPPGDERTNRRKAIYAWGVTALLTLAGFALTLLTFDPFRLGPKSYLYCLGIALVTPFLVEKVLESWGTDNLFRILTAVACTAALVSLMLLAVIRGDLMAQQLNDNAPALVLDDAAPAPQQANTFYGSAVPLLRIAMLLLSFAMELGAGLALHKAWRLSSNSTDDWKKLRSELALVRSRMSELVGEITALRNEPTLFVASFWRDFYRSMITDTVRNAMTKLLLVVAAMMLLPHARAEAVDRLNLVIAVDLTKSVATVGPDGQSDFQKNIDGVKRVLAQAPLGSHITVIGITDRSFAQPYIVLSASIPDDPGYFNERIGAARRDLVRLWKLRSSKLQPTFRQTDILGVLLLASQIFSDQPNVTHRVLILFSDMRQHTPDLDLESSAKVSNHEATLPNLSHIEIYALGVDGAGRPTSYWDDIERFWANDFAESGASLRDFSALREIPYVK